MAAAVAVTLPAWLTAVAAAGLIVRPASRAVGEPQAGVDRPARLWLGRGGSVGLALGLWLGAVAAAGLPLAALVWKAGGGGTRAGWTADALAGAAAKVVRADGVVLLGSAGAAAAAGVVTAGLAWAACSAADGSRAFGRFLLGLCVLLWVTPGPLVGLGLKDAIRVLVDAEDRLLTAMTLDATAAVLGPLLYSGAPSPVPAVWAAVVRLFPVAVAVLWPAHRGVPRELREAATLDGLGPWRAWRAVTAAGPVRAAVAVAALALGEVSASKLVNPPGRSAYVLRLFDQMHYGAESTVAALALFQTAATAGAAGLLLRAAAPAGAGREPR